MALPIYQYVAAGCDIGQYIDVSATVAVTLDGSAPFSVSGWFRVRAFANEAALLAKGTELSIILNGRILSVQIAGQSLPTTAAVPIAENSWHFIAVTADLAQGAGLMTLYLDGVQVGQTAVSGVGSPPTGATYTLGGAFNVEFLSMAFYNIALPAYECIQQWGPVPIVSPSLPPSTMPVANFDFSVVPPVDVSPAGNVVNLVAGAHQTVISQALALYGSWMTPDAGDMLNPGGTAGPFSVQAWVLPYAPTPEESSQVLTVIGNGDKAAAGCFSVTLSYDPIASALTFGVTWGSTSPFVLTSPATLQPGAWRNIAVTFDGMTLVLYVDGANVAAGAPGQQPPLAQPAVIVGAMNSIASPGKITDYFKGGIQALSIWNQTLVPGDVAKYMAQPSGGQPGCVAYFDLSNKDLSNQVTGAPVQLYETADIAEMPAPAVGQPQHLVLGLSQATMPGNWLHAEARACGIDGAVKPVGAVLGDDAIDALLADYEHRLKDIPVAMASPLREAFRCNLFAGLENQKRPGRELSGAFIASHDGPDVVIHYHGASGPEEVLRQPVTDTSVCTAWIVSVVATSVSVLLGVLGVGYSANKIAVAANIQVVQNGAPLMAAIRLAVTDAPLSSATFIKVIRTFYSAASLSSVLSAGLSGVSWWSFAFTVSSLIIQILGLWLTGGWWTLFILGQLAVSIAQLVVVVNSRPSGC